MNIKNLIANTIYSLAMLVLMSGAAHATDISPIPLSTYSAPSSTDVKPNVFFVLDDSGSMDWDFMPDWACAAASTRNPSCGSAGQNPTSPRWEYWFRNAAYNGSYYNPAVVYTAPLAVNSDGTLSSTTYPSQTGVSVATGGDSSATTSSPNWKAVKDDAYGVQSSATTKSNLQTDSTKPPYFYTMLPGEYCTLPNLKTCILATAPTSTYKYPAVIRWCADGTYASCRATFGNSNTYARAPSPRSAVITVSGTGTATNVSSITVGGKQILSGGFPSSATLTITNGNTNGAISNITVNGLRILSATTTNSTSQNTIASRVAANINSCTLATTGLCTVAGFYATVSANVVTIYDPSGNTVYTPAVTKTGTTSATSTSIFSLPNTAVQVAQTLADAINKCTILKTGSCGVVGFSAGASSNTVTIVAPDQSTSTPSITATGMTFSSTAFVLPDTSIPGENIRTTITPAINSYPYPGSTTKASTRTDCAGTTCTYAEEMTNYANWWTYYKSRMQMMKTAASNAFLTIDTQADRDNDVSRFRLGYMSINDNTGSDFVNLDEFKTAHKYLWYQKLIAADPNNSTPLRAALSTAGQLYGGKLNGNTLNGTTVSDPLQYSCQQNYTILSTDGFWNESSGYVKLDGSTTVGNQDGGLSPPYSDGSTAQLQASTSTLQRQTGNLQLSSNNGRTWSNASTCQPNSSTQCRYNWGSWSNVSSCTVNYSSGTGSWTVAAGTNCQYTSWTSFANVSSCTAVAQSVAPSYTVGTARQCQASGTLVGGTSNTLADVAAYYYNTDLRNSSATGQNATGTCTGPLNSTGTNNDLCADNVPANGRDVATTQHMTTFTLGLGSQGQMIYAPTDGKNYWNDTSGDFYDVEMGNLADPANGICSWQSSGVCKWPTPSGNSNANIDDLWHAAVNGHGAYFSATDPASLASSLTNTLTTIVNTPRPGTAAAAASSNPNVSATDNFVFSSSYKSVDWYGELIRQRITLSGSLTAQNWSAMRLLDCATTVWTANNQYNVGDGYRQGGVCYSVVNAYPSGATYNAGGVDASNTIVVNVDETATPKVPATPLTSRTIYTKGSSGLIPFVWSSLSTAQQAYFTTPAITYVPATGSTAASGLSQFCSVGVTCLSPAQQTAASGSALVSYLRGDRTNEVSQATGQLSFFRQRTHVLGDIVSSEARYVQAPLYNFQDTNYAAFKTLRSSRAGRVFVGANDGMLHAFDATTGQEAWAYIPSMVLPNMYKLADKLYSTEHQFFVDNSPETGDICPNAPTTTCTDAQWKTILVGGLNAGGKGYFALDITDPSVAPTLLWEFTDTNLGYTYGNPTITKLEDGTWVVLISSGYNNADGVGRLYVLNANTGELIRTISTGTGTPATPSGLSRVSAHVLQSLTDNTAVAAYGGDTLGNLWRFDINNDIGAPGYDAQLLVNFTDAGGNAQPITALPTQITINGKPVVYVGTGRYLGTTDVTDASTQSFYAVKDNLAASPLSNPRATGSNFVQQVITSGVCPTGADASVCLPGQEVRTSTNNPVDWNSKNGWYMDFPTGGERSSTDPTLALGTLLFTTITPQASTVSACGSATGSSASFLYALDYLTGGPVDGASGVIGISLGSGIATRPVVIEQADGTVRALIRTSSGAAGDGTDLGNTISITPKVKQTGAAGTRRVSWRVLNAQ